MNKDLDQLERSPAEIAQFASICLGVLIGAAGTVLASVTISVIGALMIAFGAIRFVLKRD